MSKEIYLSVIMPAYNEEKLIKSTLIEVDDFLSKQGYNYEIIVVDDGSKDGTSNILNNLQPTIKNLFVLKNDFNRGKGYSVKNGMLAAKGKFRLFMDADNSTTIDQISNFMLRLRNGYDIVIGDRSLGKSVILVNQPIYKQVLGNIGNIFIKILTIAEIKDTQCGFKVFSEKSAKDIFSKLTINRWGFDIEALAIAKKLGYRIQSVPVIWKNRSETKVRTRDYILTFKDLLKIKLNLIRKKYDDQK
jgi:dolichyl-phosphate beta-glucosyltransferase